MKKIIFGRIASIVAIGSYSLAMSDMLFGDAEIRVPFAYTVSFVAETGSIVTTDTLYPAGKVLAEFVYPRADGFASFLEGSCTDYVARQRPDLFLNPDGSRRIVGNAEDRLYNAQHLGIPTGSTPRQGAVAVYYNGRGGRQYGHTAYVEQVQSNGIIIVSEMNYKEDYVVTLRAVDADLAAGYVY